MLKRIEFFCNNTNIHGFNYIGQSSRHKIEKIWWALSIFTSFIITGILIYKFIVESQVNPIVIYSDQNAISAYDLYFPSLSLCPGIIFETMKEPFQYRELKEMLENGTIELENLTLYEQKMMQTVSLIANDQFMLENYQNTSIPTDNFMDLLYSFGTFVGDPIQNDVDPPYFYFRGNWSNKYPMNLTRTLWNTGFCHTFNFPNSSQMFHLKR